jgi:hypothetical protein
MASHNKSFDTTYSIMWRTTIALISHVARRYYVFLQPTPHFLITQLISNNYAQHVFLNLKGQSPSKFKKTQVAQ